MNVRILPGAREDLAEGFAFYEDQEAGVGSYFLESVLADIDSLQILGGTHRKVYGFHRMLAARFPHAIHNSSDAEGVLVRAVLDSRRDPKWIGRRLRR